MIEPRKVKNEGEISTFPHDKEYIAFKKDENGKKGSTPYRVVRLATPFIQITPNATIGAVAEKGMYVASLKKLMKLHNKWVLFIFSITIVIYKKIFIFHEEIVLMSHLILIVSILILLTLLKNILNVSNKKLNVLKMNKHRLNLLRLTRPI